MSISRTDPFLQSARQAGVFKDFHVWSDHPIKGAIYHDAGRFEKTKYLFKFTYLRDAVKKLNYDYFVWLDSDNYFVRHPGDVLRLLAGAPVHVTLESDLCRIGNERSDWWGCPNAESVNLMRARGVRSNAIFNVSAGFFIVHHDAVDTLYDLAFDFWDFCRNQGYEFTEEPPLAYAMQMLCGNPYAHILRNTADLWASDWTGSFADRLPDGSPWPFVDYFTGESIQVNPAIVHAMRSKSALIHEGELLASHSGLNSGQNSRAPLKSRGS